MMKVLLLKAINGNSVDDHDGGPDDTKVMKLKVMMTISVMMVLRVMMIS